MLVLTDKILIWFQCANPECHIVHRMKDRKRQHGDTPICFLSYVSGRRDFNGYESILYPHDNFDDDILPEKIMLWHESERMSLQNSFINPVKGIRYCGVCFKIINENHSLSDY